MTSYERMSEIINFSLDELRVITRFLHEREDTDNPTTVLIGGWAVDSYNFWYGSVDIDLITNNSTRNSLNICEKSVILYHTDCPDNPEV